MTDYIDLTDEKLMDALMRCADPKQSCGTCVLRHRDNCTNLLKYKAAGRIKYLLYRLEVAERRMEDDLK